VELEAEWPVAVVVLVHFSWLLAADIILLIHPTYKIIHPGREMK
jgi:hypothetical protein